MTRNNLFNHSRPARLLVSLLFALVIHLASGFALGSAPTQAQRYAEAHREMPAATAFARSSGGHRIWYA